MGLLIIHEILCAVVVYTTFCRLSKTSHATRFSVRFAIWLMATTVATMLMAPVLWGWKADWLDVAMLLSLAIVQVATARQWRDGVPDALQKPRWQR